MDLNHLIRKGIIMQTRFRIRKGLARINELLGYTGIFGIYPNPHGDGPDVVEIVHTQTAEHLVVWVKDQSVGNIILEKI